MVIIPSISFSLSRALRLSPAGSIAVAIVCKIDPIGPSTFRCVPALSIASPTIVGKSIANLAKNALLAAATSFSSYPRVLKIWAICGKLFMIASTSRTLISSPEAALVNAANGRNNSLSISPRLFGSVSPSILANLEINNLESCSAFS